MMLLNPFVFGGGGETDPSFSSVVLLTAFDGADGATSATDDSNSAHALTFSNTAQIDTAQSKFGGASLLIGGTAGNFVSAADHANWHLSAANSDAFTIECWVRITSHKTIQCVLGQWSTGTNQRSWALMLETSGASSVFRFYYSLNGSDFPNQSNANLLSINQWYALAVTKDSGGTIRMFLDGTLENSNTPANSTFHNSTFTMRVGQDSNTARALAGWVDEVRITKGVARYTGAYTPRTSPFPRS